MAIANNKAWYDKAFVSVSVAGGSEVQLKAKTNSMNISGGGFDVESMETFGGKIKRQTTREDFEIGFDGIPTSLQDFDWVFHGVSNTANSITSSTISDYRVTVLWTDQTGVTSATQAINTASEAYREMYVGCNMTSLEKSMEAGEHLTATMTFKTAFEDDDGEINFKKEVCDTTNALSAASAYTSTNKF